MRNLKRALSLALSAAMMIGMLVMGSSAAGYQDVDDSNDHQEAIEVLQAVGIMSGDENGNFNPDGSITRNEMAVVMAHLLNLDYDYYRGTNPFNDVPSWAAPYVAACAAEGVVAGIGNGQYGGNNAVTAAQASLMIMKALGYFQNQEDFGSDWQIATIRQASYIDMFNNINATAEAALTRGQVAQLVLNGLKAKMVDFTGDKGIQIGDVTVGYKAEYTPKTNANNKYNSIDVGTTNIASDDRYYVQLGEELYNGDLKLKGTADVFGRPARYWEYDGKEIGTYVNYDLMVKEYTTEVTGKDLYDVLGAATIKDYSLTVVIDGVSDKDINGAIFTSADMNKNNKQGVGDTGNGVLTQVFVDNEDKDITVSIINTYLAIADDDYNEKKEQASFDVYGLYEVKDEYVKRTADGYNNDEKMTVDNDDINVEAVVEDEAYLATIANGQIQTLAKAKIVADSEITAFKIGSSVTVDGTKYSYADSAEYDVEVLDKYTGNGTTNLKDVTYNVYLDSYGYAIGVDIVEAPNNYVFITGIDTSYSNLSNKTLEASAIFIDGTMKVIQVKSDKGSVPSSGALVNSWCTYTVDKDGVYTLTEVAKNMSVKGTSVAQAINDNTTGTIDKKNISLDGDSANGYTKVYGNDSTVYLTASVKQIKNANKTDVVIIDGVDSVTTGVKNANIEVWNDATVKSEISSTAAANKTTSGTYVLYKSNGYIIAAVVVGEDAAASKNLVYVNSSSVEQESYDKTADEWTWTRKVIYNGEEIQLKEVSDSLSILNKLNQYGWYQVSLNSNGEVIGYKTAAAALNKVNGNAAEYLTNENYIGVSINEYDTVLFTKDYDNNAPSMRGSTLYVSRSDVAGFFVPENAKIVLFQTNKNKEEVTYETGADKLESIVEKLNKDYDGKFDYTISAIIEDGAATTVIIRDEMNTYKAEIPVSDEISVDLSNPAKVKVLTTGDVTLDDILVAIEAALNENGYTVTEKRMDNADPSVYVFVAKNNKTGFSTEYNYDADTQIKVEAQPTEHTGFQSWFSDYNTSGSWYALPTAGLTQTVKDGDIVLSGKVTNLLASPLSSDVVAAIQNKYFGSVNNVDDLKTAIADIVTTKGANVSSATVDKAGFVGVNADGVCVALVFEGTISFNDGTSQTGMFVVSQTKGYTVGSFSYSVNGITVTTDVTGLSF